MSAATSLTSASVSPRMRLTRASTTAQRCRNPYHGKSPSTTRPPYPDPRRVQPTIRASSLAFAPRSLFDTFFPCGHDRSDAVLHRSGRHLRRQHPLPDSVNERRPSSLHRNHAARWNSSRRSLSAAWNSCRKSVFFRGDLHHEREDLFGDLQSKNVTNPRQGIVVRNRFRQFQTEHFSQRQAVFTLPRKAMQ